MTWSIVFPWPKPPMSMNDRISHYAKAQKTADIRLATKLLARNAKIPPCEFITVRMIWTVPDLIRRDAENPVATLKPICDGLVDAGIVKDDTPWYMEKRMPEIEYNHGVRAVRIEITEGTLPA